MKLVIYIRYILYLYCILYNVSVPDADVAIFAASKVLSFLNL
jgi:hypothetical protein